MLIVDAHCDTITRIMELQSNLKSNSCHIDIERMKKAGSYVQFFAAFIDPTFGHAYAMKRAIEILDTFYVQMEIYKDDITSCCTYEQIKDALLSDKIAAFLSIEDGEALQGSLSALRIFYRLGVRSICLTWNHRNDIADGVADRETEGGLTPFGKAVIKEMNNLGMLVDVSHISEKGFWDVLGCTMAPIIASHSNTKKYCNHPRNLTDEQIIAIKKNEGVMGINLYPTFLHPDGQAGIKEILNHIEHICSLTGEDHIGIGSDFDGIEMTPEGFEGVQDMQKIFNELLKNNYKEEFIEKFAGKNFLRVIERVLK